MTELEKLAKKAKITANEAMVMISYEHLLNKVIPKKKQKSTPFNLDVETLTFLKKIATTLKISLDAVICGILVTQLGAEEVSK